MLAGDRLAVIDRFGDLVVQVPAVPRDGRPGRAPTATTSTTAAASRCCGTHQLHARATILVIHVQTTAAATTFTATTSAAAHDDVVAIRHPGWLDGCSAAVREY